jgi:hypothetical protein
MADHAIGQPAVVGHQPRARRGRQHNDVETLVGEFPRERVDDQLLAADRRQRRFGVETDLNGEFVL